MLKINWHTKRHTDFTKRHTGFDGLTTMIKAIFALAWWRVVIFVKKWSDLTKRHTDFTKRHTWCAKRKKAHGFCQKAHGFCQKAHGFCQKAHQWHTMILAVFDVAHHWHTGGETRFLPFLRQRLGNCWEITEIVQKSYKKDVFYVIYVVCLLLYINIFILKNNALSAFCLQVVFALFGIGTPSNDNR